ncbi:MAG: undecaprenyldiphospho-muramoylpentapeptide beta-N-acetylglucosaminyltransferase [Verrucomicrobia bacterium]|nr:undecaprenyldiphospho-muramoylpentapeptide beta-N-acetylglucosaminyltransferase [Verrucomicrobiota bacterium]
MATVLVASGGTGGHLFPALALAAELVRRSASTRVAFVGAGRTRTAGPASGDAVTSAGFEWHAVPGRGLQRRNVLGLVPFAWDLTRGYVAARRLVRRLRPDVAVGFGNFGSVAPLVAAHRRGVPVVIHEANALAGKANRWLARYARTVAVQFERAADGLTLAPGGRVETVGMPVREALFGLPAKAEARRVYGLDESAFTLLVMGGSQGARRLNEVVCAMLPQLAAMTPHVQVVHLCGRPDEEAVRTAYAPGSVRHAVRAFEPQMERAYAAADCALCRAGAATLAELAVTGTPALLVPYPYATEAHQARNADVLAQGGAAYVAAQADFGSDAVLDFLRQMKDAQTREAMAASVRRFARPDATRRLADLVEEEMA